jgi:hypothetical protein
MYLAPVCGGQRLQYTLKVAWITPLVPFKKKSLGKRGRKYDTFINIYDIVAIRTRSGDLQTDGWLVEAEASRDRAPKSFLLFVRLCEFKGPDVGATYHRHGATLFRCCSFSACGRLFTASRALIRVLVQMVEVTNA